MRKPIKNLLLYIATWLGPLQQSLQHEAQSSRQQDCNFKYSKANQIWLYHLHHTWIESENREDNSENEAADKVNDEICIISELRKLKSIKQLN